MKATTLLGCEEAGCGYERWLPDGRTTAPDEQLCPRCRNAKKCVSHLEWRIRVVEIDPTELQ